MKKTTCLALIVAALVISNYFTFFWFLDCGTKTVDEEGGLYSYEDRIGQFCQISTSELQGETKERIVSVLRKYKREHQKESITISVEDDMVIFNSLVFEFENNKLIVVRKL